MTLLPVICTIVTMKQVSRRSKGIKEASVIFMFKIRHKDLRPMCKWKKIAAARCRSLERKYLSISLHTRLNQW